MRFKGNRLRDKLFIFYVRNIPNHPFKIRFINLINDICFNNSVQVKSETGSLHSLSTKEYIGHQILFSDKFEPITLLKCKELLNPADNFIDIGANAGLHSLFVSPLIDVNIYAIEPSADNFIALLTNIRLNNAKNIHPINIGLASKDSFSYLGNDTPANSGTIKIVDEANKKNSHLIRLSTLADLVKHLNLSAIKLIKIDVEGFEMSVFRGFFGKCDVIPENIIMEFNPGYDERYTAFECIDYFKNLGYSLYTITGNPYELNDMLPEDNLWLRKDYNA